MEIISLVLNLVFGGGLIFQFLTVRSQRKKAASEAKGAEATAEGTELENVETAIRIWREMAIAMNKELLESRTKYEEVARELEALRKEVRQLNFTSNRILKLLDKITHENLEKMVEVIKDEIQKNNA